MSEWVKARLIAWGEWRAGSRGGAGGTFPAYQLVHIHCTAGYREPCSADVLQIDRIMAHVKVHQPDLYEVADARYVRGLSAQSIAGRERCHVNTVYARLNFLHRFVENRLTDASCAVSGH